MARRYSDTEYKKHAKRHLETIGYKQNCFHPDTRNLTSFGKATFLDRYAQNKTNSDEVSAVIVLTDWDRFQNNDGPGPTNSWFPDYKCNVTDIVKALGLNFEDIDKIKSVSVRGHTLDSTKINDECKRKWLLDSGTVSIKAVSDDRHLHVSCEVTNDNIGQILDLIEPYLKHGDQ